MQEREADFVKIGLLTVFDLLSWHGYPGLLESNRLPAPIAFYVNSRKSILTTYVLPSVLALCGRAAGQHRSIAINTGLYIISVNRFILQLARLDVL